MPGMSLTTEVDEQKLAATHSSCKQHPHPFLETDTSERMCQTNRPDSAILPTNDCCDDANLVHSTPFPRRSILRQSGSKERFSNVTMSGSSHSEFPIVPTRPPLRPTVSFGTVSTISYYSSTTDDLEQKTESLRLDQDSQQPTAKKLARWSFYLCIALLYLLNFLCGMNLTSLAAALPALAYDMKLPAIQSFWIIISYLLSSTLTQPLAMRLSSATGTKLVLSLGTALFLGGSVASSLAQSYTILLVGRTLTGVGAGSTKVLVPLTLHQLVQSKGSTRCERVVPLMFWIGAAIGPIVGGLTTEYTTWRYIFYINIPFCLIGLVGVPLLLQLPTSNKFSLAALRKIDYLGWTLLATSLASLACITWSGTTYSWSNWRVLLLTCCGVLIFCLWATYSKRRADTIIPVSFFRSLSAADACFGTIVHGMAFAAIVYFMPIFLSVVFGLDLTLLGTALGMWTLLIPITAVFGELVNKNTRYTWTILAGWIMMTTTVGLMILFEEDTVIGLFIPIVLLSGMALGFLAPSLSITVQESASNDDETIHAAPLHIFCHTLGQTLGIAIGSCTFLVRFHQQLKVSEVESPQEYTDDAVQLVHVMMNKANDISGMMSQLTSCYVNALHDVWIIICISAGLALLFSVLLAGRKRKGFDAS